MRILVAAPLVPWPLHTGGNAAQFSTLECLSQDHQFTLVFPVWDASGMEHARELQSHLPLVKVRAVPVGRVGEPNHVQALRTLKSAVKTLLKPVSQQADFNENIPYYPFNPLPRPFLEAFFEELESGTDLCQVEFAEMLSLGTWLPRRLPKLFIHHQIHFVYARRLVSTQQNRVYAQYLQQCMETQELAYLRQFDGIITFSETDRQMLVSHPGLPPIFASPFPVPSDVGIASDVPGAFDGRFLFIGSEEHGPNADALTWLLEEVWPNISVKMPTAKLIISGKWSAAWSSRYPKSVINFVGFVSNLPELIRGGILLVPLRIGSGIRTKILVAMAQGVPVVSTRVGMEGLPLADGRDLMVRDRAEDFADAALRIAREESLWHDLTRKGPEVVTEHYSSDVVRQRRNEIYHILAESGSRKTSKPLSSLVLDGRIDSR